VTNKPHLRGPDDDRGGAPRALQHVTERAMDEGVLKDQALGCGCKEFEAALEIYAGEPTCLSALGQLRGALN